MVQLFEVIVDNKMNDFILVEELTRGQIIMQGSAFFSSPPSHIQHVATPDQDDKSSPDFSRHSEGRALPSLQRNRPRRPESQQRDGGEQLGGPPRRGGFPAVDSGGVLSEVTTPPSIDKESLLCESPWSPKTSVMSGNVSDGESRSVSDCLSPKRYEIL